MDFDLSRKVHAAVPDGLIVGTPRYMSPEHFSTGRTDCRTDIYALGLIFYEMLLHRPAVAGDDQGAIVQAILKRQVNLADLQTNESIARYAQFLRTALQKQPERRFRDGNAMSTALLECGPRDVSNAIEAEAP